MNRTGEELFFPDGLADQRIFHHGIWQTLYRHAFRDCRRPGTAAGVVSFPEGRGGESDRAGRLHLRAWVVVPVTYIRKGSAPGFAVLDAEGKMIAMQWHESVKKYVALDEQDSYRWSDNDGQAVLSHLEADHTAKEVTLLSACRSDDAEE
ncbi:hypothetical protein ACS5UA_05490 [Brucella sp. RRSP16]|uniref:hypothetical protein n=1 Tax=Brucella sp. RRSP16 TaxID=3453707 RepID=UPI003FCE79B4